MKKILLGTMFLAAALALPNQSMAEVNISIGISLPPPIAFQAPPEVIVIPDTNYVYAVPDIDVDMYFWNGWWWRLWQGRWYRSHYYNRGWGYYNTVPRFYYDVDPGWRRYYRDQNWYGHQWDYRRIPHQQLQRNWRSWNNNRYWERRGSWGVQNYHPKPLYQKKELRQQRQKQYYQRPDVQRYQPQKPPQVKQQHIQPQHMQPQHMQPHFQPQNLQNKGKPQNIQSQGKHEGKGGGHGK